MKEIPKKLKTKAYNRIEMTGRMFGRLTVIEKSTKDGKGNRLYWQCKCECGETVSVRGTHLRSGGTKSCGCFRSEFVSLTKTIHGKKYSKIYGVWNGMVMRCHNPRSSNYNAYGARGIEVCEEWRIFENFYRDMGDPPKKGTIDRIDNSQGYSKENCRWASTLEQSRNRRKKYLTTAYGLTMTLQEWADLSGVKRGTLYWRLNLKKLSSEDAIPSTKKDGTKWVKQDEIDSQKKAQLNLVE